MVSHKIVIAANHRPVVRGDDEGIWRRLRLIPFDVVIPENKRDKDLSAKLKAELPGILNWALLGCLKWQALRSLGEPEIVTRSTEQYRSESDSVSLYISDRCCLSSESETPSSALYEDYSKWCRILGQAADTQKRFATKLKARGFDTKKKNYGNVVVGIGVKAITI